MSFENRYKVVIVGGGPAGLTLAYKLAKIGMSHIVLEAHTSNSNKLCGGVLTRKSLNELYEIYGQYPYTTGIIKHINVYKKFEKYFEFDLRTPLSLLDRKDLNNWIANKCDIVNANISYSKLVIKMDGIKKKVTCSDGSVYEYDYLVGAGGALCSVTKYLNIDTYKPSGFCFQCYQIHDGQLDNGIADLYINAAKNGYAWDLPLGDKNVIGICGSSNNIHDSLSMLNRIKQTYISDCTSIKGAYIPFENEELCVWCKDDMYLIGDAAGLVDPLTGEGLYYAFKSANIMYNAIMSGDIENVFKKEIKELTKHLSKNDTAKSLFYNGILQTICLYIAKSNHNLTRHIIEKAVQTNDCTYLGAVINYIFGGNKKYV